MAGAARGEVVAGQGEGFGSLPGGRRSACRGGSRPRKGFGGLAGGARGGDSRPREGFGSRNALVV